MMSFFSILSSLSVKKEYYLLLLLFIFIFEWKKGILVWAHWPHVMWQQMIIVIPHILHGLCLNYCSNYSFLSIGRITLLSSHTPCSEYHLLAVFKSNRISPWEIEKDATFTHFTPKNTHFNACKPLQISTFCYSNHVNIHGYCSFV